jgi:hypothetical protein
MLADILVTIEHLAIQVAEFYRVAVNNSKLPYSSASEVYGSSAAQPSKPGYNYVRVLESLLALLAEGRMQDLPAISDKFILC